MFERKLSGNQRSSVKGVRKLVDQCEIMSQNKERIRHVYIELIKLIEELKDHQKDLPWEK